MKSYKNMTIQDDRGYLYEFYQKDYRSQQVNILFSHKGTVRGNHYHKKTTEIFFIINGEVEVDLYCIKEKNRKKINVTAGDEFTVDPYTVHTLTFKEDTTILSFYSLAFKLDDTDIFGYVD